MTGRDLVVYIMENKLEDADFANIFISEDEVAAKNGVCVGTVRAWCKLNMLNPIKIGNSTLFLRDVTDPRKDGCERRK